MISYQMIGELGDYKFIQHEDGSAEIHVTNISPRFAMLWAVKMDDLYATENEIKEYENERFDDV